MATSEVPREEWDNFFERFTSQHRGWLVTLELLGVRTVGGRTSVVARDVPLAGISAQLQESQQGAITIIVGEEGRNQMAHIIAAPVRVWLDQTEEGADERLCIENAEGSASCIRFRSPLPPEMVDGVPE